MTWASLGGTSLGREARAVHDRLAADDRIPLDRAQLDALLADKTAFVGAAEQQVAEGTLLVDFAAAAD